MFVLLDFIGLEHFGCHWIIHFFNMEVFDFSFKEVFVDVESHGLSENIEVFSREIVLEMVSDGLERKSRRVSSRNSEERHNLVRKSLEKEIWYKRKMGHRFIHY